MNTPHLTRQNIMAFLPQEGLLTWSFLKPGNTLFGVEQSGNGLKIHCRTGTPRSVPSKKLDLALELWPRYKLSGNRKLFMTEFGNRNSSYIFGLFHAVEQALQIQAAK